MSYVICKVLPNKIIKWLVEFKYVIPIISIYHTINRKASFFLLFASSSKEICISLNAFLWKIYQVYSHPSQWRMCFNSELQLNES